MITLLAAILAFFRLFILFFFIRVGGNKGNLHLAVFGLPFAVLTFVSRLPVFMAIKKGLKM
jgi:hypothetical protein